MQNTFHMPAVIIITIQVFLAYIPVIEIDCASPKPGLKAMAVPTKSQPAVKVISLYRSKIDLLFQKRVPMLYENAPDCISGSVRSL